jgi:hypothetical protein
MNRTALGAIAALLVLLAVLLWSFGSGEIGTTQLVAAALRSGALLGVLWLALPELRRVPSWLLFAILAVVLVLALRPKLFLFACAAVLILAFLRPRHRPPVK